MPDLRTRLDEHEIVLPRFFGALLFCDFPLVAEIGFVAYKDYDYVVASFAANVVNPFSRLIEGFGICYVVDYYGYAGVADV